MDGGHISQSPKIGQEHRKDLHTMTPTDDWRKLNRQDNSPYIPRRDFREYGAPPEIKSNVFDPVKQGAYLKAAEAKREGLGNKLAQSPEITQKYEASEHVRQSERPLPLLPPPVPSKEGALPHIRRYPSLPDVSTPYVSTRGSSDLSEHDGTNTEDDASLDGEAPRVPPKENIVMASLRTIPNRSYADNHQLTDEDSPTLHDLPSLNLNLLDAIPCPPSPPRDHSPFMTQLTNSLGLFGTPSLPSSRDLQMPHQERSQPIDEGAESTFGTRQRDHPPAIDLTQIPVRSERPLPPLPPDMEDNASLDGEAPPVPPKENIGMAFPRTIPNRSYADNHQLTGEGSPTLHDLLKLNADLETFLSHPSNDHRPSITPQTDSIGLSPPPSLQNLKMFHQERSQPIGEGAESTFGTRQRDHPPAIDLTQIKDNNISHLAKALNNQRNYQPIPGGWRAYTPDHNGELNISWTYHYTDHSFWRHEVSGQEELAISPREGALRRYQSNQEGGWDETNLKDDTFGSYLQATPPEKELPDLPLAIEGQIDSPPPPLFNLTKITDPHISHLAETLDDLANRDPNDWSKARTHDPKGDLTREWIYNHKGKYWYHDIPATNTNLQSVVQIWDR
jgi:hypothetical protein